MEYVFAGESEVGAAGRLGRLIILLALPSMAAELRLG
jgi:hypothetical protein